MNTQTRKDFIWLITGFILSGGLEFYLQSTEKIIGIGIISFMFISLCFIHDWLQNLNKSNRR